MGGQFSRSKDPIPLALPEGPTTPRARKRPSGTMPRRSTPGKRLPPTRVEELMDRVQFLERRLAEAMQQLPATAAAGATPLPSVPRLVDVGLQTRPQMCDASTQTGEEDFGTAIEDDAAVPDVAYVAPSRFGVRVGAPVLLAVYDLPNFGGVGRLAPLVGLPLHHTGIVLPSIGREYAFGATALTGSGTGVYQTLPTKSAANFRELVLLGLCNAPLRGPSGTVRAVARMTHMWSADGYDVLRRNCNHFSAALAKALIGPEVEIPAHVNRAAEVAAKMADAGPLAGVAALAAERERGNSPTGCEEARAPPSPDPLSSVSPSTVSLDQFGINGGLTGALGSKAQGLKGRSGGSDFCAF